MNYERVFYYVARTFENLFTTGDNVANLGIWENVCENFWKGKRNVVLVGDEVRCMAPAARQC